MLAMLLLLAVLIVAWVTLQVEVDNAGMRRYLTTRERIKL
jgi:hypothetical protein